jgi:hypothetical protein
MKPARKIVLATLGIIVTLFFIWKAYVPDYIFINDTVDRVQGSILGSSSPTVPIDLLPWETKFVHIPWVSGVPNLLKASPYSRGIEPTTNLVFIKIVKISKLPKW